jgi:hypothetical protein
MKTYGIVDVQIHIFLISTPAGGQFHALAALPPGKETPTPIESNWVDPDAGLDDAENRKFVNLPALELRLLCRPAGSQSLTLLLLLCISELVRWSAAVENS